MPGVFGLLLTAIALEVGATASLSKADGFRNPLWASVVIGGYAVSIWLLTVVVRHVPVSVTYALWSGIGTAAVALIGAVFLGESLDPMKVGAIALIVAGVVLLNLQGAH